MPSENTPSTPASNGLNSDQSPENTPKNTPKNTQTNPRSSTQLSGQQLAEKPPEPAPLLTEEADNVSVTQPKKSPTGRLSWWTLQNKATLLAVALGTIPVLIIGGISTSIAGKQLSKEVIGQQQQFTNAIALQLQDFGSRQRSQLTVDETDEIEETPSDALSERILNYTEVNDLSAIVNERVANLRQGTSTEANGEDSNLRFNVVDERRNRVLISNEQTDINTDIDTVFPEYAEVRESNTAAIFKATSTQDNKPYLVTYTPVQNIEDLDNDLGVLVYQPIAEVFAAQQSLVLTLLAGTIITALLVSVLAAYLANRATQPIIEASIAVEKLGQGKFDTRLNVKGEDELAVLNSNINVMAEQLEYQLEFIQDTAKRQGLFQVQATLAEQSQKQREALQRGLSQLIASVADTAQGDLRANAAIAEGELGTLGHLFNTVLDNLREMVNQTQQATGQIESALEGHQATVQKLALDMQTHTSDLAHALPKVEQLSTAVETIRTTAKQGEKLAYDTTKIAQRSEQEMAQSAHSLAGIQQAMSEAGNKVKQMSIASQQIHQVIALLNEISLKTNLLAINASIETRQGNEAGQDFSIVAGEIGQLTEQSTRTTNEIERIIKGIQSNLKEVTSTLELCTAQATDSEAELGAAKTSIEQMLNATESMDELLHTITDTTAAPAITAKSVLTLITQMQEISERASTVSEQTATGLAKTAQHTQVLSETAAQFTITS